MPPSTHVSRLAIVGILFGLGCAPGVLTPDAAGDAAECSESACDDDLFCNGPERCDPDDPDADARGCVVGDVSPCGDGELCDETMDLCRVDCGVSDGDGDGSDRIACGGDDCDDTDPARFPGNVETCDGRDDDCDRATYGERDSDGDGYVSGACCDDSDTGTPTCGDDCDDANAGAHPSEAESCDGADNDCDGAIDESVRLTFYRDADFDGAGDPARSTTACAAPEGHVENANDCDDTRASVNRGAPEICDVIDNDCDATVDEDTVSVPWYLDADGDFFGSTLVPAVESCAPISGRVQMAGDCDDTRSSRHPAASEVCNAVDDDCDPSIDEGVLLTFHRDADGDGFGAPAGPTRTACAPPVGYVADATDCADDQGGRNPGLAEICDPIADNDCDDETWTFDVDHDGADAASCGGLDCNDASAMIRVGATELCDGVDNDCSNGGLAALGEDSDGDGFAPIGAPCSGGPFPATDCDDTRAAVHVGAPEICNDRDDDCDGVRDELPEAQASCNLAGTVGSCTLGACTISMCTGSYANCDGLAATGCEANLDDSEQHCGMCGGPCAIGATCTGRLCRCPAGTIVCGGECVDLRTDERHCSACGDACPGGATCSGSTCQCPFGFILCGGECVDPASDVRHCGGCGARCLGGSCEGGSCECAGAMGAVCGGECHDLSVDLDHCGACDAGCRGGSCAGGACTCPLARPTICGGACTNTVDDRFRCGSCDRACGLSACVASDCDDVLSISGSSARSCALLRSGRVMCWGDNAYGQIGDGTATDRFTAVAVLTDALQVWAGQLTTCAVRAGGTVACWGDNATGAVGDGTITTRYTPTTVPGPTGVAEVDGSCARAIDGRVWCWGSMVTSTSAVLMPITGAVEIAGGGRTLCARRADGSVVCYGNDTIGQRGDGESITADDAAPTAVVGLSDAVELTSSLQGHFCARRASGAVVCWGRGSDGELGDGRSIAASVPVQAIAGGAIALAADMRRTCAAMADETVWCWGWIDSAPAPSPILKATDRPAADVAVGEGYLCVLAPTGALTCRGEGSEGQLGAGPTITSSETFIPLALP